MSIQSSQWWAVALAAEVTAAKPKGVSVDNEPIVLFRDQSGAIRALEDRCPHRRMPLSLGRVREDGLLQCGYHGWSFDGVTGQCKAIPNLLVGEKVPSTYGVFPYRAIEQNDFIYVAAGTALQALPPNLYASPKKIFSGRHTVGLAHAEFIAALMDGPQLLLDCAGIRISDTLIADPHLEDGWLVMERAAFWLGQTQFDGFVREYKLIFRLAINPETAESWLSFTHPDSSVVAVAHLAITPSTRGTTAILWRSFASTAAGVRSTLLRSAAALGRAPITVRAHIDMGAVARLLVGPSEHWQRDNREPGLYGTILTKERARL
ncbi:MAG: putative Rieske (2Fe-2S) protein [Verrucomicrobiaceae bacterium]|nr:putative Rieske (2Fe-2S) protein [Verrucomicrobiaceae bacterium]